MMIEIAQTRKKLEEIDKEMDYKRFCLQSLIAQKNAT